MGINGRQAGVIKNPTCVFSDDFRLSFTFGAVFLRDLEGQDKGQG